VSAVRYLRDVDVSIPSRQFESAVDRFLAQVEGRVVACVPGDDELSGLIRELSDERHDAAVARECRLQALAGVDPGSASREWLDPLGRLSAEAGGATDEIAAAVPALKLGIEGATRAIEAMKRAPATIRTPGLAPEPPDRVASATEWPWQRGRRLAALVPSRPRYPGRSGR
jgi:hypothetical protein